MIDKIKLLCQKEIRDWSFALKTYVFLAIYLVLSGYMITSYISLHASTNIEGILPNFIVLFVFLIPLFTSITIYKEEKNNANVLIMNSSTPVYQILIAKFVAILCVAVSALTINLVQLLLIRIIDVISIRILILSMIGYALVLASMISIGLLIASIIKNAYAGFIATYIAYLLIFMLNYFRAYIPGMLKGLYSLVAVFSDINEFWIKGKLSIYPFIHTILICMLCYAVANKVLEKRWRK